MGPELARNWSVKIGKELSSKARDLILRQTLMPLLTSHGEEHICYYY